MVAPTELLVSRPRERLAYAVSDSGHRSSYSDLLSSMFGLESVVGKMTPALFGRLVRADQLLFSTLDDDPVSFAIVAAVRAALRRRTVGLFIRPQTCFENGKLIYVAKRIAFKALRRLPRLTVATLTPFQGAPEYAEVAHVGLVDPQYWDLFDGVRVHEPRATGLSTSVLARANGRRVCCAFGSQTLSKGFSFLAETLERYPDILDETLVVCAGLVLPDAVNVASKLDELGVLIVNRFVSDEELWSLYGVSDIIWACYGEDRNQSSGVYGRAIQLGIPTIIREDSLISRFSRLHGIAHFPVAVGDHAQLAKLLLRIAGKERGETKGKRGVQLGSWRRQFETTIASALVNPPAVLSPKTRPTR